MRRSVGSAGRVLGGALAFALGSSAFAACTAFEPGTDELAAEEIQGQLPEPGRDWTCLAPEGAGANLVPASIGARRLVQSIQILNLVSGEVIPRVFVRACEQRDVDCADPITEVLPVAPDGWVDVPLYEGFAGYLEITGDTLVPTALFYPDRLEPGQEVYATPVGLLEQAALPRLTGAAGFPQESGFGMVVLRALDCQGEDARGVRYSIDKEGAPWYFVGGLPSGTAAETSDSSLGGFINVAPGVAVVSAELGSTERAIVTPTSMLVRAGWMSAARFVPAAD